MSELKHKFSVGDRVIINPTIQVDSNEEGLTFKSSMRQAGIFGITEFSGKYAKLSNDFFYAPEWLLPVPMYHIGDKVTIRRDLGGLEDSDGIRFGLNDSMKRFAGQTVTIVNVNVDGYKNNFKLGEDGARYRIEEDKGSWSWPSTAFIINNQSFKHYENQLQREKAVVSRGDRPEGRRVCCRRVKAAITVGHLSYKEISGE